MPQFEIALVFDSEDGDEGEILSEDDVRGYAEEINLETARAMVGYQGYRVQALSTLVDPDDPVAGTPRRVELSRSQVDDLLALLDHEHEAARSGGSVLGASSRGRVEAVAGVLVDARDRQA